MQSESHSFDARSRLALEALKTARRTALEEARRHRLPIVYSEGGKLVYEWPAQGVKSSGPVVAGVDIGAPRKGYHAVLLQGSVVVEKFRSCDAAAIAHWCRERGAKVVALDAPCRWRADGEPARAAERELARDRISCFSTPTQAKATGHSFYTWMFAGHQLYAALAVTHPVWMGEAISGRSSAISSSDPHLSTCPVSFNFHPSTFNRHPVSIETFPHAVACALAGELVSAKTKLAVRREVLMRAGVDVSGLEGIDELDAALCALAAERFAQNRFRAYGDAAGGFIIVPSESVEGFNGATFRPPDRVPKKKPAAQDGSLAEVLAMLPRLSLADRLALRSHLDDLERLPESG